MPLYSIDRQVVTHTPHHASFSIWRRRLEDSGDLQAMKDRLNAIVDEGEMHKSSWIPGSDWNNSGFQPIYDVAAQGEYNHAAWCFGLLLWEVMMEREVDWFFIKNEDICGMVYFQPNRILEGKEKCRR